MPQGANAWQHASANAQTTTSRHTFQTHSRSNGAGPKVTQSSRVLQQSTTHNRHLRAENNKDASKSSDNKRSTADKRLQMQWATDGWEQTTDNSHLKADNRFQMMDTTGNRRWKSEDVASTHHIEQHKIEQTTVTDTRQQVTGDRQHQQPAGNRQSASENAGKFSYNQVSHQIPGFSNLRSTAFWTSREIGSRAWTEACAPLPLSKCLDVFLRCMPSSHVGTTVHNWVCCHIARFFESQKRI